MKHHLAELLFFIVSCSTINAEDANWPQFRGSDARGVSTNPKLPDRWSATENVEWKTEIPGRGWSSPVVWGERVFLTTVVNRGETEEPQKGLYRGGNRPEVPQTEHEWKVLCLDLATGKQRWEKTVQRGQPQTAIHLKNSFASETPVTDGERVYACFGNVGLFCFDLDGNEVWQHALEPHPTRFAWGTAASPVVHGDRLYYVCDNDEQSYLLALDKRTGKELWRTLREEKSNWSTPFIWQNAQRTEIITPGTGANRSYDLDGKLLWSLRGMSSITIATPYAADGLLYLSSGYVGDKLKALYAIKPGANGDITPPAGETSGEFIAWSNPGIAPYNPSTLVHDGRLYVLYDRGLFSCFDAKTGAPHYERERLPRGPGFTASPWAVGDKIFCLDEDGNTSVLRAGDKFELLHTNGLDGAMSMSTPALAGDRLLIRTDKHLYSIRNAGQGSATGPDAASELKPFRIHVEDAVLVDLQERLAKTRWPDQIPGSAWEYGVDVGYINELVSHWRTGYDWRKHERELNALPQFTTDIDGITLHFIHVRSPHADALPLVLVHGWPGSVVEFQKIIPMLTEPEKFGGRAEDAFHVVVPSLPGFGFSSAPKERGWNSQRMAEVFAKLMARLGYARYGAQGGDWGGGIVRCLAANDGTHCIGAHSNFPGANRPTTDPMRDVTEAEVARFQNRIAELADHKAYGAIQGTRPLTLSYSLNDSPAGLAAWVVDKFWAWSDHGGNLNNSFTKDELLTNIMLYWVTQTMPSATRIYFESQHDLPRPPSMTPFTPGGKPSPMGFALFPKEINVPPRAWVERSYGATLIHWTEMPRGGHFAAMEQPQLLATDVRAFFQKVRQR